MPHDDTTKPEAKEFTLDDIRAALRPKHDPRVQEHTVVCASTGKREKVTGAAVLPDGWVNMAMGFGKRITFSSNALAAAFWATAKRPAQGSITSMPYLPKHKAS